MPQTRLKGLEARLIGLVLLAMLPVLGMALFMAFEDYRDARESAFENSRRLTRSYAAAGSTLIERLKPLILRAAHSPLAKDASAASCEDLAASFGQERHLLRSIAIYGADGSRLCQTGSVPASAEPSPAHAVRPEWLGAALTRGGFVIGGFVDEGPALGGEQRDLGVGLVLAAPVSMPNGTPGRVLSATLDLGALDAFLDDEELPERAAVSLIDGRGTILARFPALPAAVGASVPEAQDFLRQLIASGRATWEAPGLDGERRLYFLSRLTGDGEHALYLRMGLPADAVYAGARRNLARHLLFIGSMAIVVLAAAWFFSNTLLLRHIRKLWQATTRLREGNYAYRIGATGGGELGELALAFDRMAGALEDRTRELTKAETKYREIFENSAAGIFRATPDGRFVEANSALAQLLGYRDPEELKVRVTDIASQVYAEPGSRWNVLRRLDREGTITGLEFPALHSDGSVVWLCMEARAVRDAEGLVACYEGLVTDITRRKEMEEELRTKQEKLQALLEHTPALICIKDQQGRYLLANRRHEEVRALGQPVGGRLVRELYPPEVAREIAQEDALVLQAGHAITFQRVLGRGELARHYVTVKFPLAGPGGQPDRVGSISSDVTELERARQALRQSEEKFRIMIQTSPDLIWLIDPDGVLLEVNSASQELIGYAPEELRGRRFHEFFHPEDLQRHEREVVLPLFQGRSPANGAHPKLIDERRQTPRHTRNLNLRLIPKPGAPADLAQRRFELSACGLWREMRFMGTLVVIRDITDRMRAEQALRESRELLRQTQSLARLGGFSINLDSGDRSWTEECARIFGMPGSEKPEHGGLLKGVAPQDREALDAALGRLCDSGEPFDLECRLANSGATACWVRIMARRSDAGGHRSISGVVQDITERKELERLRADIDSIIRHDLKAPLNGIINLPQLMRMDDNLTPEQEELLRHIEESGWSMLRQIDMSLDLMKIEQGRYVSAPSAFDLVPLCREILRLLADASRARCIPVELTLDGRPVDEGSALACWGEERLCHPLLANLLLNAVEASPNGEAVELRLEDDGNLAVVSIRNKGEVPPELRPKFFEKYATSGKSTGTGLGTYSAMLFARAQGGWVELDCSEPGATTVTVRLPRPERTALA